MLNIIYSIINIFPIITIFFLSFIPNLGDENWIIRDNAHYILLSCRPFSDLAIIEGCKSEELEISYRSNRMLLGGSLEWILNCEAMLKAQEIIYTDYPDWNNLPWLPSDIENLYSYNKKVRDALYFKIHELRPDWNIYSADSIYLYGLNDIRFYVRGLQIPSDAMFEYKDELKKWKELKKTWRKK